MDRIVPFMALLFVISFLLLVCCFLVVGIMLFIPCSPLVGLGVCLFESLFGFLTTFYAAVKRSSSNLSLVQKKKNQRNKKRRKKSYIWASYICSIKFYFLFIFLIFGSMVFLKERSN